MTDARWQCRTCGLEVPGDLAHHADTGHAGYNALDHPGMHHGPWIPDAPDEIGLTTTQDGGWD